MIKKTRLWLMIFILTLALTGCWDKVELENRGFVNAMGIDKYREDKPGVVFKGQGKPRFTVSMSLPDLESIGAGQASDTKNKSVKTASDKTISGAMSIVDANSNQKLYFGQTKAVILGEKLMNDENRMREVFDALERNYEISRKLIILSTDGDARRILTEDVSGEPLIGMFVSNFYKSNTETATASFKQDLEKVVKQLRVNGSAIIPKIELNKDAIKLGGAAVIKDFKQIGWINDKETRAYLMLKGEADGAKITAFYDETHIPLSVNSQKSKIEFIDEDGKILCIVNIKIEGSIDEYKFEKGNLAGTEKVKELTEVYEELISDEVSEMMDKFQKKYAVDAIGMGEVLRKNNYGVYLNNIDNWELAFAEMETVVNVEANITSVGSIK